MWPADKRATGCPERRVARFYRPSGLQKAFSGRAGLQIVSQRDFSHAGWRRGVGRPAAAPVRRGRGRVPRGRRAGHVRRPGAGVRGFSTRRPGLRSPGPARRGRPRLSRPPSGLFHRSPPGGCEKRIPYSELGIRNFLFFEGKIFF